jgi:hypothetical protein
MTRARTAVLLAVLSAAPHVAGQAPAERDPRFSAFATGAYGAGTVDFTAARRFTEFLEPGQVDSEHTGQAGASFEIGLAYSFSRTVSVYAAFGAQVRDGEAAWRASFPHPLFFNRPRQVEATVGGLEYEETLGHLDLMVGGGSGSLRFAVFAGPSLIGVKAEVLDTLPYSHTYPYDAVQVTSTPTLKPSASGFGFNAGGRVDWRLGRRFALGAQARFSRASVELKPTGGEAVKLDAGGLAAGLGLRLWF